MTQVYAVAGTKGGVGKTTTAANVGVVLASAGANVVIIDADIGAANLAAAFGLSVGPDERTIHDVLAGRAQPEAAVREVSPRLRIVPGGADLESYAAADPAELVEVIGAFDDAQYVVVDTAAGLGHDSAIPLAAADDVLLVSTAEQAALIDTDKTRELAERLGTTVAGVALTRVPPSGADTDIRAHLTADVRGEIPEDPAVTRATTAGDPVVRFAPETAAAAAYRALADELTAVTIPGRSQSDDTNTTGGAEVTPGGKHSNTEPEIDSGKRGDPGEGADGGEDMHPKSTGRTDPVETEPPAPGTTGESDEIGGQSEPDNEPEDATPRDEVDVSPELEGGAESGGDDSTDDSTDDETRDGNEDDGSGFFSRLLGG